MPKPTDNGTPSSAPARIAAIGLALALLALWLYPAPPVDENKAAAAPPVFRLGTIASAELFRSLDQGVEDNFGLKSAAVALVGTGLLATGLSPSSQAIIAPGGKPYLSDDFKAICLTPEVQDQMESSLAMIDDRVRASGGYFLYAITPDKTTVEREELGPLRSLYAGCNDGNIDYLSELGARGALGEVPVLTAFDEFAAATASKGSQFLYGDSHWDPVGAQLFASLVFDRLERDGVVPAGIFDQSEIDVSPATDHVDDLYQLMGVERIEPIELRSAIRDGVTSDYSTEPLSGGWVSQRWVNTSEGVPLVAGRTLILQDSMFGYNGAIYSAYFEDVTALPIQALADPGRVALLGDYDLVIVQQVQRTLPVALPEMTAATWF